MALSKVTYTDLVTVIGAQNLNDIQDAIIALEEWQSEAGADIPQILANIAPSFSNSTSYSAGDCVIVLNKLYQFIAAHPAGNWTGADATEVNVTSLLKEAVASLSGEVDDLKSALDQAIEDFAVPTQEAVNNWLTAHPEATTTVQDGSLTEQKFSDALKLKTIKDYVTPEMFGARGDNTTDDSAAIQSAIDYAQANSIRRVQFMAKKYRLASAISLANCKCVDLVGASSIAKVDSDSVSTFLRFDGSGDCIVLDKTFNCGVYGIALWHSDNTDGSVAIHYRGKRCQHNIISNCSVYGFNYGAVFDVGTGYDRFEDVYFSNCFRGFVLNHTQDTVDTTAVNYLYIDHCAFGFLSYTTEQDVVCIEINEAEYLYITNCDFITGTGIKIPAATSSYQHHDITIKSNIFFQCIKSIEILAPVLRATIAENIHRLGVYAGSKCISISSSTNSQDILIADKIQYVNRSNVSFPYMEFNKIFKLDFRCTVPPSDTVSGDASEQYPMSITASTIVNDNYIVANPQWYSCAPGTATFNFSHSLYNWVSPSFVLMAFSNNSGLSNITMSVAKTGRQCAITLNNSGSANVNLMIKPVYVQG